MEKTSVSITKCSTYNLQEVQKAVVECVDAIGASSLIKPGDRVLVKPNMLHLMRPLQHIP